MQDSNDIYTYDVFSALKRSRGRPVSGSSLSNAERQRAYRLRKKLNPSTIPITQNISLDQLSIILNTEKARFENLYHQSKHEESKLKNMASLNALVLFEMILAKQGYKLP